MFVLGVDENGLGPRLGPLVATSVAFELERYDRGRLRRTARAAGIDDSKATSAFGAMAPAESLALAVAEQLTGRVPEHADEMLAAISLDSVETMREPCPSASAPQCWSIHLALPCFGGDVKLGRKMLGKLEKRGVRVVRARSAIACASVYNALLARAANKFVVDLELFERLLLDMRAALGATFAAYCGMVGGIRKYHPLFQRLDRERVSIVDESRGRSAYHVEEMGDVVFEVDADAAHPPVALASMLGKYVRELAVARQNRFYGGLDPSFPEVSGYYDPKTRAFIQATRDVRLRLAIADDCFLRVR